MKTKYILVMAALIISATSCEKLEQTPSNRQSVEELTTYDGILNAAYYYQLGMVTPMAVMGDFRADNAVMDESPFTEFDMYGPNLTAMEDQFFGPFYTAAYRSILSCNLVIEQSPSEVERAEAKFLRALTYFKLVQVFGDVPLVTIANPNPNDESLLPRVPASEIYNSVIIADLESAISVLDVSIVDGRASKYAAEGLLGKVYMHMGNYGLAQTHLESVVNGASAAGINLQSSFDNIFGVTNDLNSEILFATQVSSSIVDEYSDSEFWVWYGGLDTKSLNPLDQDLVDAFDASPGDLRRAVTIDTSTMASPKYPQTGGPDHDWIELRLADVILLYAEALNENGSTPEAITELNKIRTRAGLANTTASSQADVRQAIADERRLELAFEGHRWFDLVRTNTVDAEIGQTVNSNYHLFPIPISEILASFNVITQNPGY